MRRAARTLFAQAAESVAEMNRATDTVVEGGNPRRGPDQNRNPAQLRQELVMTIARYDGPLAYQVLASTRPLTPPADNALGEVVNPDENLEQMLLSRVASSDPKLALQNAEQFLEKGEFPRSLSSVLSQLQEKDKEAATKLEDKLVQRLQSVNLATNLNAGNLAVGLLTPGPRPTTTNDSATEGAPPAPKTRGQILSESSYQDVMRAVIDAALRATPAPAGQRTANAGRGRARAMVIGGGQPPAVQSALTEAEVEQNNSRMLLNQMQSCCQRSISTCRNALRRCVQNCRKWVAIMPLVVLICARCRRRCRVAMPAAWRRSQLPLLHKYKTGSTNRPR